MTQHIVNISGGKDSAACYLIAMQRGIPFRAVTADTGHEHPETYEWIERLHERTGGPKVESCKADFSRQIEGKRRFIERHWAAKGVPQAQVDRALEILHPTGNPFLDLCMWKGRFPSIKARFCTEELKHNPIDEQVMIPALGIGPVVRWQGERRDESPARSTLPMFQRVRRAEGRFVIFRPIIHWTASNVFALHRVHGLMPNPLYLKGMSRVGCFPCVFAKKSELAAIARRFPEAFEKLAEWERIVADVAKRHAGTFFSSDKTPEGAAMAKAGIKGGVDGEYPNALEVAEWAKTTRGGRQYDMAQAIDDASPCSSQYGLCE